MSNALHWQVKIVMSTKQPTAAPDMPATVAVPTGPVAAGKRPAELQSTPAPHLPLTRARSWHATAKHACGSSNQPMVWYRQSQQPDSHVEPCPKLQAAATRRQRPTRNRRDRFQPSRHFARYLAIHHWRIASQHLSLHVTSPTGSSVRSLLDKGSALSNRGSHLHRWLEVCLQHRVANSAERRYMQHHDENTTLIGEV